MRLARWLLPLLSLLAVLWFTWRDVRGARTGPGPLHSAHAAVAELANGANCRACHRVGAGVDADGCVRCHPAIGAQRTAGTGLHGRLEPALLARCERCHGEHHGDEVALLAPHAFARAGVPDPEHYDHGHVLFTLTGAHAQLACRRCHPRADDVMPPKGGRFLGPEQRCPSCHDDAHRGAFGSDCASCHGQEQAWQRAPSFQHASFSLAGAHAAVACASCHPPGGQYDVAAERTAAPPTRSCAACHANPHDGDGTPTALRLPDAADCARCHAATKWQAARPDAARHAELGFALRGAHAGASCASCHGDAQHAPRWRERPPGVAACSVCHADPHGAGLRSITAASAPANGCAGCHLDSDTSFTAGRLTAEQHRATGFVLQPPHADVACARCHDGPDRPTRFPGRAADDCRRCHADAHAGQFAHEPRYAQCTACHAPTHFQPHGFGVAAHAATAFPLTGAHAAVACQTCHVRSGDAPRRFAGTRTRCAECHVDVHRGTFDRSGRPQSISGRTDCARCHGIEAFTPVLADFEHATWTGYALAGAHEKVACSACHPPAADKRLGRAAGSTCAACHQDPHAGQFAAGATTDCARCHVVAGWRDLRFDHATQSRFPLDATHAKVACNRCHFAVDTGARTVIRYKPLGTACSDCHRLGRNGEVVR